MRRRILPITLAALSACQPPVVTEAPTGAVGHARAAALPEPGVYILQRVKGMALPADLKPPEYDRRLGYNFYERVLGGWLYLTSDSIYRTVTCADLVDSTGRAPETMDRQSGDRYWAAGGRVYFGDPIADGPGDSTAVRVVGDTVEFVRNVFVRDRTSVPPRSVIAANLCRAVRASPGARAPGT